MDLPIVLKNLLEAQENFDSILYSECFSDDAMVFDEGETHKGKEEIKDWNEKTNEEYKTICFSNFSSFAPKTSLEVFSSNKNYKKLDFSFNLIK